MADEKDIAPDSKLWAESLTPEQALFIITVWNDGGEGGLNEMLLFVFDEYEKVPHEKRREVGQRAIERFFSKEAFDEFARYQCRERLVREIEKQEAERGNEVLGGRNDGSLIIVPGDNGKRRRGQ